MTTDPQSQSGATAINSELFTIPCDDKFIVYAPRRQAAFLANAGTVNLIDRFQRGAVPQTADERELIELLESLQIISDEPEFDPTTTFTGNSHTFFLEGHRNLALKFFGDIVEAAPDKLVSLIVEGNND